jgi:hypothetical protein
MRRCASLSAISAVFFLLVSTLCTGALAQSRPQQRGTFAGTELKSFPDKGINAIGILFADGRGEAIQTLGNYANVYAFADIPTDNLAPPIARANFLLRVQKDEPNSFPCSALGFSSLQLLRCFDEGVKTAEQTSGAPVSRIAISSSVNQAMYSVVGAPRTFLVCSERREPFERSNCSAWFADDGYVMSVNVPLGALRSIPEIRCAAFKVRAAVWPDAPPAPPSSCPR